MWACVYVRVYMCDKTNTGVFVSVLMGTVFVAIVSLSLCIAPCVHPLPPRATSLNYNQFGSNRKCELRKQYAAKHICPLA